MSAPSIHPTFRRATLADRPAMLEICATVWDGEDYLPSVFDKWVAASGGQFTAVVIEGRVVALAKLTRFASGEYWLEGIRVHPDYRGQGIAAALHHYHLDLWRRSGEGGTLRLVTHSENHPIINLCEHTGFTKIFEFTFAVAEASAGSHHFTPVAPAEAQPAFAVIQPLPVYVEQHHLCDLNWKWRELTPTYLAERIAAKAVYHWNDWEGVLLTLDESDDDHSGDTLCLQFPGVPPEHRPAFLSEARALAHELGKEHVRWAPLTHADRLNELPLAGYRRTEDDVECCFEARA